MFVAGPEIGPGVAGTLETASVLAGPDEQELFATIETVPEVSAGVIETVIAVVPWPEVIVMPVATVQV